MLTTGFTAGSGNYYFKDQLNIVTLHIAVSKTDGFAYGVTAGTLPVGFRPTIKISVPCYFINSGSSAYMGIADINTNGTIVIQVSGGATMVRATTGTISFIAAS